MPAKLFCMNPGCDSVWECIFKSKRFRQRSLQFVSSCSSFSLLFLVAPGMRFFWSCYFRGLGLREVLPSPSKTQCNFEITVWQTAALRERSSSKWRGRLSQITALHDLEKGPQWCLAVTALTPCRPWVSNASEHHHIAYENPRELLCTVLNLFTALKHQDGTKASLLMSCYNRLIPHSSIK